MANILCVSHIFQTYFMNPKASEIRAKYENFLVRRRKLCIKNNIHKVSEILKHVVKSHFVITVTLCNTYRT